MVRRSHGFRVNSRKKLSKTKRERGLTPITHSLRRFEAGEKVLLKLDSSVHKGMPNPRFHGRVGIVKGKRGRVYEVEIKDGKKRKTLLCGPEHMVSL